MERIICAALRIDETGKIYYGHRHSHCISAANGELSWELNRQEINKIPKTQGFITSMGRFVDRKVAWDIAEKSRQIIRSTGGDGILYSEDIY